jgi:hypothetical protein
MSAPIAPVTAQPPVAGAAAADAHKLEKLHKATEDFESILVKQLLNAAKLGGQKSSGYADMAVDALATGVEKSGGLGLARRLEAALSHSLSLIHDKNSSGGR